MTRLGRRQDLDMKDYEDGQDSDFRCEEFLRVKIGKFVAVMPAMQSSCVLSRRSQEPETTKFLKYFEGCLLYSKLGSRGDLPNFGRRQDFAVSHQRFSI